MKKAPLTFEQTQALHQAGDLEAAEAGYLTLLKKSPRSIDILHALSILFVQQQQYEKAINLLQQAIHYHPQHPVLYLHLANTFKAMRSFPEAKKALEHAIQLNPNYSAALNNLGTIYFAEGKLNEAIHHFRQALQKQSDYPDAYYNLGLALAKQNALGEAIHVFETLIHFAPQYAAAYFQLGCLLMRQEKMLEAIDCFLSLEKMAPQHIETQINLATCHLKQGDDNQAKKHYLQALEHTPGDTQILFNLGIIYMRQGDIDRAIQQYQRVAQLDPDHFAAHNNLGVALLNKQNVGLALQHFQTALRLQPENEAICYTVKMLTQDKRLLAAPSDYIKNLFDAYADHYEPHLLMSLEYQVPQLLLHAVKKTISPFSSPSWDILDLGCGTGLCGRPFKPFAKTLTGVDLSEKMLDIARQKNIYDHLIVDDITHFLTHKKNTYELIVAGDVFIYIGDLKPLFLTLADSLQSHGMLVFNSEVTENDPFVLNQSGRFAHHKNYIDQLANQHHFTIVHYQMNVTRMQNNEPVYGHVYVLKRL